MEYLSGHHVLNADVPIDGQVEFHRYYREDEDDHVPSQTHEGRPYWNVAEFPFRDHRKDDAPWAAFPEKPNFKSHPVWEWENPDADPHESLTLSPSLGLGEPMYFHCWVRDGEVDWL